MQMYDFVNMNSNNKNVSLFYSRNCKLQAQEFMWIQTKKDFNFPMPLHYAVFIFQVYFMYSFFNCFILVPDTKMIELLL